MVRFTKNELEQIKQRADGISISEVIRDAVLSKNNIERPDRVTKKELIKISQRAAFLAASEAMAKRQNR
jgi:hypothetical protein